MATGKDSKNKQANLNPPRSAVLASPNKSSSKRKSLKIIGIVVAVLLVLFILIGIFADTVTKYSVTDLVTENRGKISFSRPGQWKDASNIDKLKKDFGLNVANASIFGDKIAKDKNGQTVIPNAFVVFGQANDSVTDVSLFKQPAGRTKFEKTLDSQLQKDSFKSTTCQSIDNFSKNYNYDLNNFPVSVAININCRLADSQKSKYNANSIEMRLAIVIANDGKTYVYALIATDKSWSKNEPVYLRMLEDFKAQP